jgi:hypothetical protein
MTYTAQPERTFALVVGIEQYDVGASWNLDGPALDAVRFVEWLRAHQVPACQIYAFVSPLDDNADEVRARLKAAGVPWKEARRDAIRKTVTEALPTLTGDLLYLFWGGHGVVTKGEDRRLFYANAAKNDKDNLDFRSLLDMLRSNAMVRLSRQIAYVDACASYFAEMNSVVDLPPDRIPSGDSGDGIEQYVLFAAAPGETAVNHNTRRSGAVSSAVLEALAAANEAWPPDPGAVIQAVQARFETLRGEALSRQTPLHFIWIDPRKGELRSGPLPAAGEELRAAAHLGITIEQLRGLVGRILECPALADEQNRETFHTFACAGLLRPPARHADAEMDLLSLIIALYREEEGRRRLLDALKQVEPDRRALALVEEYIQRVLTVTTARACLAEARFTMRQMQYWYFASVPDYQQAPEASDLDAVLDALAQMGMRRPGITPLVEFMVRVSRAFPLASLDTWINGAIGSTARFELNLLLDLEAAAVRARPVLLVEVQTADRSQTSDPPKPTGLAAWLFDGQAWTQHWVESCAGGTDEVCVAFGRLLFEAQDRVGHDMTVEFLVPRKLFDMAPEKWLFGTDYVEPQPIGVTYPVVLRWRERLRDGSNVKAGLWRSRIETIRQREKAGIALSLLWVPRDTNDVAGLRSKLHGNQAIDFVDVVGLPFVPPGIPDDVRKDLVVVALVSGAPFALWLHTDSAGARQAMDDVERAMRATRLDSIPELVRALRVEAQEDPGHFAHSLSIIWDDPTHAPPELRAAMPEQRGSL